MNDVMLRVVLLPLNTKSLTHVNCGNRSRSSVVCEQQHATLTLSYDSDIIRLRVRWREGADTHLFDLDVNLVCYIYHPVNVERAVLLC